MACMYAVYPHIKTMLQIKFDQDWPTSNILLISVDDDRQSPYYKLTLFGLSQW